MSKKLTKEEKRLNAERRFLKRAEKETGLSGALLYYALSFGIMGLVSKNKKS